jgi:hypothetical protein
MDAAHERAALYRHQYPPLFHQPRSAEARKHDIATALLDVEYITLSV